MTSVPLTPGDLVRQADALLRGGTARPHRHGPLRLLIPLAILVGCSMAYGAVMGSFTGLSPDKSMQMV